jgi:hypothetical protein
VQQGPSDEHLGMDNDARDRLRNGNNSNVAVSSGSDMANLVNSVLQQVMGAYTQSGRPNQQQVLDVVYYDFDSLLTKLICLYIIMVSFVV